MRVPRELLTKIGKHWGSYMIAIRSFHGGRCPFRRYRGQATAHRSPDRDKIMGVTAIPGERPRVRSSPMWQRYYFARSRRLGSAIRAWSVRQSFHAFGNDLAELHHLLAQSRVFYNFAMDPVAVGTQLFAQVA